MSVRSFLRSTIWSLLVLALIAHIGGGWYFSGQLIEDGFTPDPDPLVSVSGDYVLEETTYTTKLGPMEAWYLPATGTTWVIHVHGKGATPAEAEHLFRPIQQAGYPQLSITYRNDEQQPLDPSGYYQYGATEWEDIAGAVEFAEANGAKAFVFSGFSTGASHIFAFIYRHNLEQIRGVVLDSPNIDMGDTVDFAAAKRELPVIPATIPPSITWTAKFITSLRIGVNWQAIDYVDKANVTLRPPVLIHHGTDDESVPITQSISLAEIKPDLVRLVQVQGAGHVDSYEIDPEKYVEEVLSFLEQVG